MPSYSGLNHGQLTLSGSAQQLAASQDDIGAIAVRSMAGNTNKVYVGAAGVTAATGYELNPSESVAIDLASTAGVYVIGTAAEKVCWIANSPS